MRVVGALMLSVITFNSCRTAHCESVGATVDIYGFDSAEVVMVNVTTYKRGSGFTEKLSQVVLSSSFNQPNRIDSFKIYPLPYGDKSYVISQSLSSSYDIIITIPGLAKEYKIRDLDYIQTKRRESAVGAGEMDPCTNDGQVYINNERFFAEGSRWDKSRLTFSLNK